MTGIALLGAGIFAKEGKSPHPLSHSHSQCLSPVSLTLTTEHLPAILAAPALSLKAIYSRSRQSAEALAASLPDGPSSVAIYYDSPAQPGTTLDDLLQRDDIAAVDVALPILHQPEVVRKAIAAGKHVLSEKPVAGDVAGARELLGWYEGVEAKGRVRPLWAVAENWRFMESLGYAAEKVREVGGRLVTFRLHKYGFVRDDNKYFNTECRLAVIFWVEWDGC